MWAENVVLSVLSQGPRGGCLEALALFGGRRLLAAESKRRVPRLYAGRRRRARIVPRRHRHVRDGHWVGAAGAANGVRGWGVRCPERGHRGGYVAGVAYVQVVTAEQFAELAGVDTQSGQRWVRRRLVAGDAGFFGRDATPLGALFVSISRAEADLRSRGREVPDWAQIASWVPVADELADDGPLLADSPEAGSATEALVGELRSRVESAEISARAAAVMAAEQHLAAVQAERDAALAEAARLREAVTALTGAVASLAAPAGSGH